MQYNSVHGVRNSASYTLYERVKGGLFSGTGDCGIFATKAKAYCKPNKEKQIMFTNQNPSIIGDIFPLPRFPYIGAHE